MERGSPDKRKTSEEKQSKIISLAQGTSHRCWYSADFESLVREEPRGSQGAAGVQLSFAAGVLWVGGTAGECRRV